MISRMSKLVAFFVMGAVLVISAPSSHAQCQNQTCEFNVVTRCYECVRSMGFFCSLQVAKCSKLCTSGVCGGPTEQGLATGLAARFPCQSKAGLKGVSFSPAQSKTPDGTQLRGIMQPDSPLILLETTHGVDDLLEHAVVENISKKTISSYRIGWIMIYADTNRRAETGTGKLVTPSGEIEPGVVAGVSSQNVPPLVLRDPPVKVVFFVFEVQFRDGSAYHADVDKITEAERLGGRA